MKHTTLGDLDVARLGLGTMGMSMRDGNQDEAEAIRTIHRALDLGVTLIDTAEVYAQGANEELVGRALKGRRDQVVLATKFGMTSHRGDGGSSIDSSPENIRLAIEGSLRRLDTDHIDLYYQHRVDGAVPIEDTIGTVSELVEAGKVRYIGLSEAWVDTIRRAHAVHPIAALQSEYSLWTRRLEDGVTTLLRELGIGLVPYSPLGKGLLTGAVRSPADLPEGDWRSLFPRFAEDNLAKNVALADKVREIAEEAGGTPAQVALAWLLAKGEHIVPIPGTRRVARLEENLGADTVELSTEQLSQLDALPPAAGSDHPEGGMTDLMERG